MIVTDPTTS